MNFLELTWWESDNKHLYSEQFKLQLVRWGCYQGVEIIYSGGNGEWKIITSQNGYGYRSSRPDVFCKIGALRNFAKFAGKHLCQSHFFNKIAGFRTWTRHHFFKKQSTDAATGCVT